jgi:hypothetical protein
LKITWWILHLAYLGARGKIHTAYTYQALSSASDVY